jgi:hypothetical protein
LRSYEVALPILLSSQPLILSTSLSPQLIFQSLFPRQSRGLDKTWSPSKGLKIKNTVMLVNHALLKNRVVSASHLMVQVGEIPDQVRDDNLLFLDNIDYEWLL